MGAALQSSCILGVYISTMFDYYNENKSGLHIIQNIDRGNAWLSKQT